MIVQSVKSLSQTPPMSNLVFLCLSSHNQSDLLARYEPMAPRASVGYVQTTSNDVAQASQLEPSLISQACHPSGDFSD
jgi:hypothetical protein